MDNNKILNQIMVEYNRKLKEMKNDFGDKVILFENDDWTETELIAYDLGFSESLMIVIKILNENGVE